MREMKCVECGTILTEEMKACPNCGCPRSYQAKIVNNNQASSMYENANDLQYKQVINNVPAKKNKNAKFSLIIGLLVVVMGIVVVVMTPSGSSHYAMNYDVGDMSFGADFYTEIYEASNVMVDELDAINRGMEVLSHSMITLAHGLSRALGLCIVAIGLGIVSISIINMGKVD